MWTFAHIKVYSLGEIIDIGCFAFCIEIIKIYHRLWAEWGHSRLASLWFAQLFKNFQNAFSRPCIILPKSAKYEFGIQTYIGIRYQFVCGHW